MLNLLSAGFRSFGSPMRRHGANPAEPFRRKANFRSIEPSVRRDGGAMTRKPNVPSDVDSPNSPNALNAIKSRQPSA
ncbi:MAG: hypothetical protein ACTS5A_02555, partial [Candidatus Hodgkinia cicadicola]